MHPLLTNHGVTSTYPVTLASYGSTVRARANSGHTRATSRLLHSQKNPPIDAPPARRSLRKTMAIVGATTLLLTTMLVAASAYQVSVYEETMSATAILRGSDTAPPSQVHMALGGESTVQLDGGDLETRVGVTISWATDKKTTSSSVRYGLSKDELSSVNQAEEAPEQYDFCSYTSPWFHHVTIPGDKLLPATTYYYQCGDDAGGWSDINSFKTVVPVGSEELLTFGVIGDLGQTEYSEQTLRHLLAVPSMSAILHAGDLSYADSEQYRWDRWGNLVEPLAAREHFMISPGNHEEELPCQSDVSRFVAYQVRFRMPYERKNNLQRRNLYYGFRVGLTHFIILTPYVDSSPTSLQYKWFEQELLRVDRSVTPWVVVIMHGPWYNSNTAHQGMEPHMVMKKHMEELFYHYKVDLAIAGHVHAYERSHPVYKEKLQEDGTVYIVLGDAGNREGLAPTYFDPQPEWSAFRQADYGYSLLNVLNRTHATMQWYEDRAEGDSVLADTVTLTTTKFRMRKLPKSSVSVAN